MLIGELFGTPSHKVMKSISSSGKKMFIVFNRGYENRINEFSASIKYNKIDTDCQSWLVDNTLISQNNPNMNCSWIITREIGSYITLVFSFIEVKQIDYYCKNAII